MFQFRTYTADELSKMSDYERDRIKNIEEMRREMDLPLVEAQQSAAELAKRDSPVKKPKTRTRLITAAEEPKFVRRSSRIILGERKVTNYNEESDDENENNIGKRLKRGSLKVRFHWAKSNKYKNTDKAYYSALNDDDFIDDDDEDNDYEASAPGEKRKRSGYYNNAARLAPSAVTQQMIDNITYSSSNKKYSENGTTCHQCRQKTTDQKSFCRVKTCRGKRGNFCGFCLGGRYNEDVAEVLLNPKWACPPCRGYCNCSICRRRNGMVPTGQLVQQATAGGFNSVRHMLSCIEGENKIDVLEYDDNKDDSNGGDDSNKDDSNGGDDSNKDDRNGGEDSKDDSNGGEDNKDDRNGGEDSKYDSNGGDDSRDDKGDRNGGEDSKDDSNKADDNKDDRNGDGDSKDDSNKDKDDGMMNGDNENNEQGNLVNSNIEISADGSPEFNENVSDDAFNGSNGPCNSVGSWCSDSVSNCSSDSVSNYSSDSVSNSSSDSVSNCSSESVSNCSSDSVGNCSSDSVSDGPCNSVIDENDSDNIITENDSDEMKIDKLYRQLFLRK